MTLPTVEHETATDPRFSVIWLHGLGADGHDFAPIVPELVAAGWPALRFVFPHAPVRPVTINNGLPMRAWYDIQGASIGDKQDAAGIGASVEAVRALIARENERGVPSERILLAGFSQGAAMALATGLRHPQPLAGLIALSGYLPLAERTAAERDPANLATPIFQAHGQADPVVPLALGERSRQALMELGCAVAWHTYPMAHAVCADEIADLRDWIGARLSA